MKIAYYEFLQSRRASGRRERFMERLANEQEPVQQDQTDAARDAALDLRRTLAILSRRERAVVVLNYAYGYSHGEMSELTGLPLGTVKS